MKTRNSEELMAYAYGLHDTAMAFRHAADQQLPIRAAFDELVLWIENVLTPFVHKLDAGEITTAEFPQPPILGAKVKSDGSANV